MSSLLPERILVCVAWPYANYLLHVGHVAGAYLPADIFARYHRLRGNETVMVSGSDCHGTPITVSADKEGVEPRAIVDRYHAKIVETWERLGIQWECYTTTLTENHYATTQEVFLKLLEKDYLYRRTQDQLYDPEANRFLPDRYVEGTCPKCGYGEARGGTISPNVRCVPVRRRAVGTTGSSGTGNTGIRSRGVHTSA